MPIPAESDDPSSGSFVRGLGLMDGPLLVAGNMVGSDIFIVAADIVISTFGCMNDMILTGARVYYSIARHGLFFRAAGTLNVLIGRPAERSPPVERATQRTP